MLKHIFAMFARFAENANNDLSEMDDYTRETILDFINETTI